jgi:hypothetical protein
VSKHWHKSFSKEEIFQLMHLGNMRYWSLFSKQFKYKAEEIREAEK